MVCHTVRCRHRERKERREMGEICFVDRLHRKFYVDYLPLCSSQDVYHKALIYCIGISTETRYRINEIFDLKRNSIKTGCLNAGWQTGSTRKVIRLAYNLYCNGTPSSDDYQNLEDQIDECRQYAADKLFCCPYAPYFWQAIQLRYPEYANKIIMGV